MDGETVYGLRQWENEDIVPRSDDVFQERLYCIRYVETATNDKGREIVVRHFIEPDNNDLAREQRVIGLLKERFSNWHKEGYIPSMKIPRGYNTDQPIRERGWTHWHHLFNPRQLLTIGTFNLMNCKIQNSNYLAANLLRIGGIADYNSKLCRWNPGISKGPGSTEQTFYNMALNTHLNYGTRALQTIKNTFFFEDSDLIDITTNLTVKPIDARICNDTSDFWITDPPYADAVNYHELSDYFLAWYEKHLPRLFPDWYAESKAALAVKGNDQSFRESMVDCYSNFTRNMPDNGAQVVMFTHQDSAVWADLALILWASGLQVTAAWTIQTETDAVGIKKGNYVQGTVIMVLRKQMSEVTGFLSDIQADVEYEVKEQLQKMLDLDDKEDPNFTDTDYQLAAYAAALRVLTSYKKIQDIDVHYELMKERTPGEKNEIQKIIDSAVAVACDFLVPANFDPGIWRVLSPQERFYIKGLEFQSHGEYRNGVFQELARGFGIREYKHFLKSGKANETRLMTATEFATKNLHDEFFGQTMVRNILFAIRETVKEESPQTGRNWLYTELPDYWAGKQRIIHILKYIVRTASHMEHWINDVSAAKLLAGYIENDHV
jgi:hypothetical protein